MGQDVNTFVLGVQRRSSMDFHRSGGAAFISNGTNSLSIDFTVYNPSQEIFAAVRLFTFFPAFGGGQTQVRYMRHWLAFSTSVSIFVCILRFFCLQIIVRTVTMFDFRFQPSIVFEIVLGVLIFIQMIQMLYVSFLCFVSG